MQFFSYRGTAERLRETCRGKCDPAVVTLWLPVVLLSDGTTVLLLSPRTPVYEADMTPLSYPCSSLLEIKVLTTTMKGSSACSYRRTLLGSC